MSKNFTQKEKKLMFLMGMSALLFSGLSVMLIWNLGVATIFQIKTLSFAEAFILDLTVTYLCMEIPKEFDSFKEMKNFYFRCYSWSISVIGMTWITSFFL